MQTWIQLFLAVIFQKSLFIQINLLLYILQNGSVCKLLQKLLEVEQERLEVDRERLQVEKKMLELKERKLQVEFVFELI